MSSSIFRCREIWSPDPQRLHFRLNERATIGSAYQRRNISQRQRPISQGYSSKIRWFTMTPAQTFNEDQRIRWNGTDGEYWTTNQDRLDRTLAPVTGPLLTFAQPRAGSTVIEVGCGCGATTIELARAVGPSGRVVGIDLSEPMLALATDRLRVFPKATCLLGDAAELPLRDLGAELI